MGETVFWQEFGDCEIRYYKLYNYIDNYLHKTQKIIERQNISLRKGESNFLEK